jgi:endonuclease/exonuclease/phosphatase (EEP) superfamily protein YafD
LTARRRQAAAIIASLGSWTGPAVLAGDFNTWLGRREAAVRDLLRAFPQSPPEGLGATWFGPLGTRAPLDHVFARHLGGTVAVRRVPNRFGSDHQPLLALVDLR